MFGSFLVLPKDPWRAPGFTRGCDILRFAFLNNRSGCSVENKVEDDQLLVQVDQ